MGQQHFWYWNTMPAVHKWKIWHIIFEQPLFIYLLRSIVNTIVATIYHCNTNYWYYLVLGATPEWQFSLILLIIDHLFSDFPELFINFHIGQLFIHRPIDKFLRYPLLFIHTYLAANTGTLQDISVLIVPPSQQHVLEYCSANHGKPRFFWLFQIFLRIGELNCKFLSTLH